MRLLLLLLAASITTSAAVRMPAIFSNHMVIQADLPPRIWGTASPGERVAVRFAGQENAASAGANGRWNVDLKSVPAGGPFEIEISGENTIRIRDVLVGEVWLASGQSNMAFALSRAKDADQEIASANSPAIRLFKVKLEAADRPTDDVTGEWKICTPETAASFSAIGYLFARGLHQNRRTPVGVIQAAWGGTPVQSWIARDAIPPDAKLLLAQQRSWNPGGPYNAMIAPLAGFTIRGAIWYQGETDSDSPEGYGRLFRALIENWRAAWGEGAFPFLFVQLPNLGGDAGEGWIRIREEQASALKLPKTAMVVALDVGESGNIHPKDKQTIASRLVLAARGVAYGEPVNWSGPILRRVSVHGNRLLVDFDAAGPLAARDGGPVKGFEIAGADGAFHQAAATIKGTSITLTSPEVARPRAVRYARASDPICNLVDRDGLPAGTFRSEAQ